MSNCFIDYFKDLAELETDRLILRKLTHDDAAAIFSYARLPRVSTYCLWPYHRTLDDTYAFLNLCLAGYQQGQVRDWAWVRKTDGRLIGTGGFTSFDADTGTGTLGYVLHPDFWQQGYATEAVRAIVQWGFAADDLERIAARVIPGNTASQRVLEKCGFVCDGTIRQAQRKSGFLLDLAHYSILRKDVHGESYRLRCGRVEEQSAVEVLTLHAFQYNPENGEPINGVEPSELPLVCGMFREKAISHFHVLEVDGQVAGYILYARGIHSEQPTLVVEGLTIMGVHPLRQRKGLGIRLLAWSLEEIQSQCDLAIVVGHPEFYPRAGFQRGSELQLTFGFPAPDEACMVKHLSNQQVLPGRVDYHPIVHRYF